MKINNLNKPLYIKEATELQNYIKAAVSSPENSLEQNLLIRKSNGLTSTKQELMENIKILTTPGLASEWVYKTFLALKEQHPDLKVEFLTSNFEIALDAGDFDIYIGPLIKKSPKYKSLYLASLNFRLYASNQYIEKYGYPKNLQDLKNHKLIKFSGLIQAYFSDANRAYSKH